MLYILYKCIVSAHGFLLLKNNDIFPCISQLRLRKSSCFFLQIILNMVQGVVQSYFNTLYMRNFARNIKFMRGIVMIGIKYEQKQVIFEMKISKIVKKAVFWQKNRQFFTNFAKILGIDKKPTNTLCVQILAQLDHFQSFFCHFLHFQPIYPLYFQKEKNRQENGLK